VKLQLERPAAIDLVAIEAVEATFDETMRVLAALEHEAEEAGTLAARLEAQLREEGGHPETASWMLFRFREFLDELRAEAEEEACVIVESARHIATHRRTPLPLSFAGALRVRTPIVEPEPEPLIVQWTPPVPVAIVPEPEPAPVALAREPETFAELALLQSTDTVDEERPRDRDFWTDVDEPKRWWRRSHVSTAAALTVGAILAAVLAVIVQVA
jgi:hypothetical protein